jgi:ankyrin repeat protein
LQEKLNLILQPQPNKIRPKGDTKILCRLLVECKQLQKIRRKQKAQHRHYFGQRGNPHTEGAITLPVENGGGVVNLTPQSITHTGLHYTSSTLPVFSSYSDHNTNLPGTAPFGIEASALLPLEEQDKSHHALMTNLRPKSLNPHLITGESELLPPFVDWHLLDISVQPENLENTPVEKASSHVVHYPARISNIYENASGPGCPYPDFGFGSDFGLPPANIVLESGLVPSMIESTDDQVDIKDNLPSFNVHQSDKVHVPFAAYPLKPGRFPIVNSTYMQENLDTTRSLLSDAYSSYDIDATDTFPPEVEQPQLEFHESPYQAEYSPTQASPSAFQDEMSIIEKLSISKHSSLSSKLSTFLSKVSSTSPFTLLDDAGQTPMSINDASILLPRDESPVILPGVFPEYCWQHINQNKLRRCGRLRGLQKCNSKRLFETTVTHRSLRADILSRIIQRTIRAADIHEIDTFGNSVMHISATMSAPPSYLVSLIKLGANVNALNNAKQTFLHLVKPEVIDSCDDFCYLLEILSVEGFNFSQHDDLGQSSLHLLTRLWINPDILRKVVTKLDSLPIHTHISTARDCLGYTVIGQINLQAAQPSGLDLDHAILSLACDTEKAIMDPRDLQWPRSRRKCQDSSSRNEQPIRNYENHPSINTVEDLIRYEQHVDYWRIITSAVDSPWFEDSNGKNGLHCLAEASLVSPDMPLPDPLLVRLNSLNEAERAKDRKVSVRERFIQRLLEGGVDPNNYDNEGSTPLMAFVIHTRPAESDSSTARILNYLVEAGSDIHRRNRQGETALHLSIKLGRRAATKALLAFGANIHARTSGGLGVLELGHNHAMESSQEGNLYSQIILCMSLAASFGAVSQPTILDEWGSPHYRLAEPGLSEPKSFKAIKKFISSKANK